VDNRHDTIKQILVDKLEILTELRMFLRNYTSKKQDTSWGLNKMPVITNSLDRLKQLDKQRQQLGITNAELFNDKELAILSNKLKQSLIEAKNLIVLFRIGLEGGRQHVKARLKEIVRGKKIKGYGALTR